MNTKKKKDSTEAWRLLCIKLFENNSKLTLKHGLQIRLHSDEFGISQEKRR